MTERPTQSTRLVEQDEALARLLEDLLGAVPDDGSEQMADGHPQQPGTARPLSASGNESAAALSRHETAVGGGAPGPSWAAVAFRALLFRVGEQRFAMPLIALHSVTLLEQLPTALPGQPHWQIGIIHYRGQSLHIADTTRLLGLVKETEFEPRYLLVLGNGQLALACDRIDDAIEVTGGAVRWRQPAGPAQWLVGFLADSLAAVLDPWVIEQKLGMDHA